MSLPPSFAIQWLVPVLSSFNSAYPGIDVRIQAVDRQEDKLADDVDVAIFMAGKLAGLARRKIIRRIFTARLFSFIAHRRKTVKNAGRSGETHAIARCLRRDWQAYTRQLGLNHINVQQGPIFSHSAMVLQAAIHGQDRAGE